MLNNSGRGQSGSDKQTHKLSLRLEDNIKILDEKFTDCPDVTRKRILLRNGVEGFILFIDGLVDIDLMQRDFIAPLLSIEFSLLIDEKRVEIFPAIDTNTADDIETVVSSVMTGATVFIADKLDSAIVCNLKKFEKRSISEPVTEKNVRGSHEGFVETLNTNMSILRRRVKYNNLKFKTVILGTTTHQTVAIAYVEGIANPELVNNLYNKIKSIDFDGLLANGYIEQLITDFPNSPFPQYQATERPDKAVAALLDGKMVIILEGTPVVLVVPVSIFAFFQSMDDYSTNWLLGSFLRLIRLVATILALFMPALYIAITSFHYYMVPLNLLIPLAESRAKVPFPPIVEILIMEITIEMIREAAIRLPTYIGTTIGVVGGLIIGQAAVEAGIVSDVLIIIIAITAIASYVIPNYDMAFAVRLVRFALTIFSAVFGIVAIIILASLLFAHLVTIESLGQPYFQPLAPFKSPGYKDIWLRLPMQLHKRRTPTPKPVDKMRGKNNGEKQQ